MYGFIMQQPIASPIVHERHTALSQHLYLFMWKTFLRLYTVGLYVSCIPYFITKGGNMQVLQYTLYLILGTITYNVVHPSGSPIIVIDSYTHNFTSGCSVSLGTQLILVCRVVGLPYGTPLSYTWTCPNGSCEVERYYGRKIYNEHILAVNTTSTSDGGTYTCQVTATGGQEASGSFTLRVTGMSCTTGVS